MWRDTSSIRMCLCFFAMTASARAGAGGVRHQVPVMYSESSSMIQAAQCPPDPNHRSKDIYSVSLRQGQRKLETVTTRGSPPPPTLLKLASRGVLPAPANRSTLVVALEPSVSFTLEDVALNCQTCSFSRDSCSSMAVSTVRSYQALKMNWAVEKLHMTPDSVLAIEVMDEGMGWRSVWTSSHRTATRSIQFDNSTSESDDMTILKVVDTADVFSLTVLVSQDSTLPADSDKWRYTVKVGGVVKDSQRASSAQTRLSLCKIMGPTDLGGIVVPWPVLIGVAVAVPVLNILALGLIFRCRRSKTSDRASRLSLEANHYNMLATTVALDHKEDLEESHTQDGDALKNAVMLRYCCSTDSGGTGR